MGRSRRWRLCGLGGVLVAVSLGCALTNPKPPLPDATHLPELVDPPEPASRVELEAGVLTHGGSERLGDVMKRVASRLKDAGIDAWSVYAHDGGFAVVTRIEHVDERGRPAEKRFEVLHPKITARGFEPEELPPLLFNAATGTYRFFVLLVRSQAEGAVATSSIRIDGDDFWEGELPEELEEHVAQDLVAEVLVYELERGQDHNRPAEYRAWSQLSAAQHLEGAGLFTAAELGAAAQ
jgi:hypothetical protein